MLDTKQLGRRIAFLRKQSGMSQEKLAELLTISPQAISKWENGHTVPETLLLPVLAQIFGCSIDEIIMPAYAFEPDIEEKKAGRLELQARQIADYIIRQLGDTISGKVVGLDDAAVLAAVRKVHPNLGNCKITRGKQERHDRYFSLYITVTAPQKELRLLEKVYRGEDRELRGYELFRRYTALLPQIYYLDFDEKILLVEDLNDGIQGFHFDEDNEDGEIFRKNYPAVLAGAAKIHAAFWENQEAFFETGPDWRHKTKENLLAHIDGMEQEFLKYRSDEEAGSIPKVWNGLSNGITKEKLDCFQDAIRLLRQRYVCLLDERLPAGKNITVIHGDFHPGNIFLARTAEPSVRIIDLEAFRTGLCTEDLAMLLALHTEPDKRDAEPLLKHYYECLCKRVKGYSYEMLLEDYKISIMEAMFYPIRLINNGIFDFAMRDRAVRAYESFVSDSGAAETPV